MQSIEIKFLSTQIINNNIGAEKEIIVESEPIPIIKIEDIYAKEFYEGNESGYKPSLRLRISNLNYNNQSELIYMNTIYTIIRTQEITADELILVCERKINNVENNKI